MNPQTLRLQTSSRGRPCICVPSGAVTNVVVVGSASVIVIITVIAIGISRSSVVGGGGRPCCGSVGRRCGTVVVAVAAPSLAAPLVLPSPGV